MRIGAPSVGHSLYTMARLFAYMLDMKEPRFVTGYTPREIDFALERNEIDARVSILDSLLTRNAHWLDKDLVDIHATMDIPKGIKQPIRRLAKLPEIESFARSNQDRRLIQLFRGARDTGQPFVLPPGTPAEQVKILREAMRKAFADPGVRQSLRETHLGARHADGLGGVRKTTARVAARSRDHRSLQEAFRPGAAAKALVRSIGLSI